MCAEDPAHVFEVVCDASAPLPIRPQLLGIAMRALSADAALELFDLALSQSGYEPTVNNAAAVLRCIALVGSPEEAHLALK